MSNIQDQAGYSRRNMIYNLQQLMELGQQFEPAYQATKGAAEFRLPEPDSAAGHQLEHKPEGAPEGPVDRPEPVNVPVRGKAS